MISNLQVWEYIYPAKINSSQVHDVLQIASYFLFSSSTTCTNSMYQGACKLEISKHSWIYTSQKSLIFPSTPIILKIMLAQSTGP